MKRALVPFLMISSIAHVEIDAFQQEGEKNTHALSKQSNQATEDGQGTKEDSLEQQFLIMKERLQKLREENANLMTGLTKLNTPEVKPLAQQQTEHGQGAKEKKEDSLEQQFLIMKERLQELRKENANLMTVLTKVDTPEVRPLAQQQTEQGQGGRELSREQQAKSSPKKCYEVFATGAVLWWCAHEDGLAYASTGFNSNPTTGTAPAQSAVPRGSIRNFGGDYHPGFKAGLGYLFSSDWDIYFNWTRLRQHPSHDVEASSKNGSPLYDEWGNQAVVSGHTILSANADWKLNYNTLDLEVGKKFMPTKRISFRPHAGLRGVIILQNYNVTEVVNIPVPVAMRIVNPTVSVRNFNNYRGIALRAGLNSGYHFFPEWEVFGSFAASVISGKFKVLNYQTTNDNTFPKPYMNVVDRFWSVKPELEAALGIRWGRDFADDRCHIQFDVAWEELWLPSQNQMRRYLTPTIPNAMGTTIDMPQSINEKGDLGLYGITIGARLDF